MASPQEEGLSVFITIVRVLVGAALLVAGINGFTKWFEPDVCGRGVHLVRELWASGFVMETVSVTHIFTGALLLVNRFVPLALLVHVPVTLSIVLFHIYTDPNLQAGLPGFILGGLHLILLWAYRKNYSGIFAEKASQSS